MSSGVSAVNRDLISVSWLPLTDLNHDVFIRFGVCGVPDRISHRPSAGLPMEQGLEDKERGKNRLASERQPRIYTHATRSRYGANTTISAAAKRAGVNISTTRYKERERRRHRDGAHWVTTTATSSRLPVRALSEPAAD